MEPIATHEGYLIQWNLALGSNIICQRLSGRKLVLIIVRPELPPITLLVFT